MARACLQISKLLTEWSQKAALTLPDDVNESIFIVLVNFFRLFGQKSNSFLTLEILC